MICLDPSITIPTVKSYATHAWHLYPIQVNPELLSINRNKFIEALKAENIGTSVHFIPLHLHPYYRKNMVLKVMIFQMQNLYTTMKYHYQSIQE